MPAPANDAQAAAETVTVGPYWGVIEGTTVDATEDAGGPFAGFGAQEVWYTWSSLPAGQVFFYLKPATPQFVEMYAWSCAPGAAADIGNSIMGASGDDTEFFMCMGQGTHTGGPMTLAVLTYVGSPGPCVFQVGWGHQLDVTASHWGTSQQDPWAATQAGFAWGPGRRGVYQTESAEQAGSTPVALDQAVVDAAYANARMGVVHDLATGTGAPPYVGPGPGTSLAALDDKPAAVGQYTVGKEVDLFTPSRTKRTDRVGVNQQAAGVFLLTTQHGRPVAEATHTPSTFDTYAYANGRAAGLVWGFDLTGDAYALRDLTFHLTMTAVSTSTREDAAAVRWRAVPESMRWATSSTTAAEWNRLHLATGTIDTSYILPTDVGAELAALADGANVVVVADPAPLLMPDLVDTATDKWLVGVLVDQSTLDGTGPAGVQNGSADNNRNVEVTAIDRGGGVSWNAMYEARLPPYLPYLGFPLIPPVLGGWHVGRAAMSTSGPW